MDDEMMEEEENEDMQENNSENVSYKPVLKVKEDQLEFFRLSTLMPDHWEILKKYYELDDVRELLITKI